MESSSDSWELASMDSLKLAQNVKFAKKSKEPIKIIKMKILHKILLIVQLLEKERECQISKGLNEYEIIKLFKGKVLNLGLEDPNWPDLNNYIQGTVFFNGLYSFKKTKTSAELLDREILFFVTLNKNHISSRIYFVINSNEDIQVFHEYILNGKLVLNCDKYNGNCLSVDFNGVIKDQTFAFSKNCPYNRFYLQIIESLRQVTSAFVASSRMDESAIKIFQEIDSKRLKTLPTNIAKIKNHPLYIVEEQCRNNEFIYPKRPVVGLVKGVPVYLRDNLKKLRTETGWLRVGKCLQKNDTIPYRISQDKKYYAEFQVKDVEIQNITGRLMSFFHPNLVPKNAVYFNYDSEICREIGVEYSDCLVGFKGKEMVIKGFFAHKKDCFMINQLIKEKEYYKRVDEHILAYESSFAEWKLLIKRTKKYLNISKRIGL